jgi:protein phosphatase
MTAKARKCNGIDLDIVGRTDVGKVRKTNEDEIIFDVGAGIAILADGMGGLERGEVASRTAAEAVFTALRSAPAEDRAAERVLRDAIAAANEQVLALSKQVASGAMGTTLAVWLDVGFGQCFIAHVGDSRVYRLRQRSLQLLTEDHSVVQQLINEGVLSRSEARVSSQRNIITRAIGLEADVEIELRSWVRGRGDVFLLCSDGLTDMLSDGEVEGLLNNHLDEFGQGDLQALSESLIEAANNAGGNDNISVLLVRPDH